MVEIEINGRKAEVRVIIATRWYNGFVVFRTSDSGDQWIRVDYDTGIGTHIGFAFISFAPAEYLTMRMNDLAIMLGPDNYKVLEPLTAAYKEAYDAGQVKNSL
jgi:hypothetical protein